ncbi:hypothetical protein FKP32DRAFT_1761868 [Trametes sanguinea]|nr:hypothetical protein FKP32DRAFT_1761868 [Trametes sanguinea]
MAHKAVPLDTATFLEQFLKRPSEPSETPWTWESPSNPFEDLRNAAEMKESKVSELFVRAVNQHDLAPGLTMALSEDRPDKGDSKQLKIDSAFYRSALVPTDRRPHWADQLVCVEFKAHDTANDPYDDREPGQVDALAETRKQVRGQIIHYAEQIFEYQHRTALIFLIIIGRRFRFSRWDRSGTIVTPAVDYVEHPEVLCEMLWHMGRLSDEALGVDPTAHRVMPGSEEYAQMLQAKQASTGLPDLDHAERELAAAPPANAVFRYVREMFEKSLDEDYPWYRLDIPHEGGVRSFLVGKPIFCAPGMAGRGTKGFVALEVGVCPARFVWLKDAWRTQYEFVAQEGEVLKELNDAGVINVPTLICHGDIPGQETQTPTWWEFNNRSTAELPTSFAPSPPPVASSSRTLVNLRSQSSRSIKRSAAEMEDEGDGREECPLRRHKHYRIVVEEVGMKLVEFKHGQQLLQIVYDCVSGHEEAVVKAHIMHRDISGGNILILPKVIFDAEDGTYNMKWTGQFMSVAVLNNHSKKLEISDELEAFFHVTLYYAVRYLKSNCSDVGAFIENYFDTYALDNGIYRCGDKKSYTMMNGSLSTNVSTVSLKFGTRLDNFFAEVLQWFKSHYAIEKYNESLQTPAKTEAPKLLDAAPAVKFKVMGRNKHLPPPDFENELADDSPPAPTDLQRQNAAKIATHQALLWRLMKTMLAGPWPSDRAEGDNVPADFVPQVPVGPPPRASLAAMKKRKTDVSGRAATLPFTEDSLIPECPSPSAPFSA